MNNDINSNTWYWNLWKWSVIIVGFYAMLNLSADFLGFGMMPFSWPAILYVLISWVILKFAFNKNSW